MEKKLQELKIRLAEINDLESAASVLNWDQSTFMPPLGAAPRARQMSTLVRLSQEKFIDPAIGHLLDDLRPLEESLPYDSDDASLIRVTRRSYERALRIPPDFISRFFKHGAETYQVWTEARPSNDFAMVRPYLEKSLDFSRQMAQFFPGYEHIADPLIDFSDYGMKASHVRAIFSALREQLVPLVQTITNLPPADDTCLRARFPEKEQLEFGIEVIRQLGFDFERGRQDKSPHPFTTSFSVADVRITTRVDEHNFGDALFSTIHEAGHAMYEQGISPALDGGPLAGGISAGVHESQSRLWENIVGRSLPFWRFFYPRLQRSFPAQFGNVSLETFYRAINKVEKSLIRTDADEVTYNLHVMLRFELELQLLEGSLEVRHLPQAWNERFQADLGITPPDDRQGVLQDVHWYGGGIGGAFQGYTLGNIMSGIFYQAALRAHPEIPAEIEAGRFNTLHQWLKQNIYQHGRKFTASELLQRITGSAALSIEPYMDYLRNKYQALYQA